MDKYKSIRVKADSHKKLKLLAAELEIPVVQVIDLLLFKYEEKKK